MQPMISLLLRLIGLSYRNPRQGMREVHQRVSGYRGALLIFGVAFSASSVMSIFVSLAGGVGGVALSNVVVSLLVSLMASVIAIVLIYFIGKMFGGKATPQQVAVMLAWHNMTTAIFAPLVAIAQISQGGGLISVILLVMIAFVFWLLANFTAETHGFRSASRVAAVMFVMGFLLSSLIAGLILSLSWSYHDQDQPV